MRLAWRAVSKPLRFAAAGALALLAAIALAGCSISFAVTNSPEAPNRCVPRTDRCP